MASAFVKATADRLFQLSHRVVQTGSFIEASPQPRILAGSRYIFSGGALALGGIANEKYRVIASRKFKILFDMSACVEKLL